jgi:hypothetical protein
VCRRLPGKKGAWDFFLWKRKRISSIGTGFFVILLGLFNGKVGRENIFKPTIGNESLHQDSHDIGVKIVNFATSKIWLLRV